MSEAKKRSAKPLKVLKGKKFRTDSVKKRPEEKKHRLDTAANEQLEDPKPHAGRITKGTSKIRVKKSIKEQLMQLDRKQRKELIRELRQKKKPQFSNAQQAKTIWEKLRSSKTSDAKKAELTQQLWDLVKGSASKLIFAHDMSRVIQCLLVYGNSEIRDGLFEELKPELIRMSKSQYARFFVVKMLKHGSKYQRDIIIHAMFGHYSPLLQSKVSAKVAELVFNDYATPKQRFEITSEFFGKEFTLFRSENNFQSLKEIQEKLPEKIEGIMKNLEGTLRSLADKDQFKMTISHKLLSDFFRFCTKTQKLEMIDLIKERLPEICHTKEGSDVCLEAIWNTDSKNRKLIVKSFKGLAVKSAMDQYARRVLFALFDTIDDTTLLNKIITKEIADNVADVIYDKWGVSVLHYIVSPRDVRIFGDALVKMLSRGDNNEYSKKNAADRYKQIFEFLKKPLFTFMAANMRDILYNKISAVLVLDALEPSGEDDIIKRDVEPEHLRACFEAVTSVAGEEFIPYEIEESREKHIIQSGPGRFVLNKLLKQDKNRTEMKLSEFMAALPREQLRLFSTTNPGCFALRDMATSGSAGARKAVVTAIDIQSLKNKTGYTGAKYLLEELAK